MAEWLRRYLARPRFLPYRYWYAESLWRSSDRRMSRALVAEQHGFVASGLSGFCDDAIHRDTGPLYVPKNGGYVDLALFIRWRIAGKTPGRHHLLSCVP